MALLHNSFFSSLKAGGISALNEVSDITSHLVHAIEQPINGLANEVKEIVQLPDKMVHTVGKLGTYFAVGWLAWTAFSEVFPYEKRALTNGIDRAFKRSRLR